MLCVCCSKPVSSGGSSPQSANIMAIHDNAGIRISQQVYIYIMYICIHCRSHSSKTYDSVQHNNIQ